MTAQWIVFALMIWALSHGLIKHGEPTSGSVSFWADLLSIGTMFALLWWGGFWEGFF